jgi:S1-C subfamily serine protease
MHRPAARRPRLLAGTLIALAVGAACTEDGPATAPHVEVVAVRAQPCDRPLPSEGVGVVLADGVVVTAGHVVEGPRRDVTVDGEPAIVVALDARTDLGVLRADVSGRAELADDPSGATHVATPARDLPVRILRTGALVVEDTTDRASYTRQVHTITPDVVDGTSGAPLVDGVGHVLGIVVLANRNDATSYAVTRAEIETVLGANRSAIDAVPVPPATPPCPD